MYNDGVCESPHVPNMKNAVLQNPATIIYMARVMPLPILLFNLFLPIFCFFQLLDCQSTNTGVEHKLFGLLAAQVAQNFYGGNSSFSHDLCIVSHWYINHRKWSRQSKMLQVSVWECRLNSGWQCWQKPLICHSYATHILPSLTWNGTKVDFYKVQVPLHTNGCKSCSNWQGWRELPVVKSSKWHANYTS